MIFLQAVQGGGGSVDMDWRCRGGGRGDSGGGGGGGGGGAAAAGDGVWKGCAPDQASKTLGRQASLS